MDSHSKLQRSYNMSRIRKFGNRSTELRMIGLFREFGITGWRRHLPLPGRPDFSFRRERLALFIDGCFWHHCPRCQWTPASNAEYWVAKFARNVAKDREATRALQRAGWTVVRIWEHSLKNPTAVIRRLQRTLARQRR